MKKKSLLILSLAAAFAASAVAQSVEQPPVHHVLLISIDGMHAIDFLNCSKGVASVNNGIPYCPNLAKLGVTAVNYVAASTSKPSDSFPGLETIISGSTPRSMGVYYDVAYDRSLDPPAKTTGNGVAAGDCKANTPPTGTRTEYEEGIEFDQSKLNGGAPGAALTEGSIASIDPMKLPRDPAAGCAPVWPWNFPRTNTIFSVIHAAGGYTAWSDKHPAYASVAGPGGGSLNDFYAPEINSAVVALPGITTPTGINCTTIPDPANTGDWTKSFKNIQCYDTLKVNAILNEIDGKTHNGKSAQVPTIFGMNFQAVSIGQKLVLSGGPVGGYLDAAGTPAPAMLSEIQFVDESIGKMMKELQSQGLADDTMFIITAKHGQSPIDPSHYNPILNNGTSPATLLASYLPFSESPLNTNGIGPTEDDVSLIWLADSANTATAVNILEENTVQAGIGEIFYGPSLALNYNMPGLAPNGDPRSPDIIVTPNVGVVYTGSTKKHSEHGGFGHDDTNVMLLLSNPKIKHKTVYQEVGTIQVAPTILSVLGIDPQRLDGVRRDGTAVLPQ